MKKFTFILISILLYLFSNLLFAQQANEMFLHAEFVKENKIAIRLLPTNIKAFEDYKDLIIEIKKFKLEGNNKIADAKIGGITPGAFNFKGKKYTAKSSLILISNE